MNKAARFEYLLFILPAIAMVLAFTAYPTFSGSISLTNLNSSIQT